MGDLFGFGSLFSSALGYLGQMETNEQNRDLFNQGQQFNSAEAAIQRNWSGEQAWINRAFQESQITRQQQFQERMANTAWQRGIEDMKTAGLNPMLAYRQGGAQSPAGGAAQGSMASGAAASGPQPPIMGNAAAAAIASASSMAAINNIQAETEKKRAETDILRGTYTDTKTGETENVHIVRNRTEVTRLQQEAQLVMEKRFLTDAERRRVEEEIRNAIEENRLIKANTRNTTANAVLHELQQAEARNRSAFHLKYPGYNVDIAPFLGDVGKITNSARDLGNTFYPLRRR